MANDPEKTGGEGPEGESSDGEEDRPTVTPPFDPIAFAQEILGARPSPAAGTPAAKTTEAAKVDPRPAKAHPTPPPPEASAKRTREPTLGEIAAARNAVKGSSDKPASAATARSGQGGSGEKKRVTPGGLLSLANARVPSNLPPRKESNASLDSVEREWVELATRPPPAVELDPALDDPSDLGAAGATKPPPPQQQALIDASSRGDEPPSTKEAPDLIAAAAKASAVSMQPAPPTAQEMHDRVSLGDYTGALEIAETLLAANPLDAVAEACAETCRAVLRKMYKARIGPLDRVPVVMVARDQLRWLSIDHRAGFVLSLVDGVSTLEMILDVSGMPELDALKILSELAQQRIISFR